MMGSMYGYEVRGTNRVGVKYVLTFIIRKGYVTVSCYGLRVSECII